MPLLVLTIDSPTPAMGSRHSELAFIGRALELASRAIRAPGGAVLSGTILGDGAAVLGHWEYQPQASS